MLSFAEGTWVKPIFILFICIACFYLFSFSDLKINNMLRGLPGCTVKKGKLNLYTCTIKYWYDLNPGKNYNRTAGIDTLAKSTLSFLPLALTNKRRSSETKPRAFDH